MTGIQESAGEQVVRSYYAVLRAGAPLDPDRLRALLAPDLVFEGPIAGQRVGAEPFIKGVAGFVQAARSLDMVHELHAGEYAATLYDAELPGGSVRFAEFFQVRDGRICSLRLMYDPAEFLSRGGR